MQAVSQWLTTWVFTHHLRGPISKQCRPVEGLWDLTNMELSVPPTVAINTARAEWLLIASTSLLWSLEASRCNPRAHGSGLCTEAAAWLASGPA